MRNYLIDTAEDYLTKAQGGGRFYDILMTSTLFTMYLFPMIVILISMISIFIWLMI